MTGKDYHESRHFEGGFRTTQPDFFQTNVITPCMSCQLQKQTISNRYVHIAKKEKQLSSVEPIRYLT